MQYVLIPTPSEQINTDTGPCYEYPNKKLRTYVTCALTHIYKFHHITVTVKYISSMTETVNDVITCQVHGLFCLVRLKRFSVFSLL